MNKGPPRRAADSVCHDTWHYRGDRVMWEVSLQNISVLQISGQGFRIVKTLLS